MAAFLGTLVEVGFFVVDEHGGIVGVHIVGLAVVVGGIDDVAVGVRGNYIWLKTGFIFQ